MRYTIILVLTVCACFGIQHYALKAVGGRPLKSESNYFSSLGRIQAGATAKTEIMVVGSSLTGRLPDVSQGFAGVANMGCDGGNAVEALRAMDQKQIGSAPWLFVEVNTLSRALDETPSEISRTMAHQWFQVGLKYPLLSAYARPSAFLYSKLLAKKLGAYRPNTLNPGYDTGIWPVKLSETTSYQPTPRENVVIEEVTQILHRLQASGSNVVFVWLPPRRVNDLPPAPWILTLVQKSGAYWWDVGQHIPTDRVRFTDGAHMDANSAARMTEDIISAARHLGAR